MSDGIAVGKRPAPRKVHQIQNRLHFGMGIAIDVAQLSLMRFRIFLLSVSIRLEHCDDVEFGTVSQRIVDNMKGRSGPQNDLVTPNASRNGLHRHDCPMCNVSD